MSTVDNLGVVSRATNTEVLLQPGPSHVEYDTEAAGTISETPDGAVVHQQPSRDPRRKAWEWQNYRDQMQGYQRVWPLLQALRSRTRKEAGLCPYVYLLDNVTGGMNTRTSTSDTVSSGSGFTATLAGSYANGALVGAVIVCGNQARSVIANTGSTATVGDAWIGNVSGSCVVLRWSADWVRVRVLEVSRRVADGTALKFDTTRLAFVIDDSNYTEVG